MPTERSHGAHVPEGRPSRNFYSSWCDRFIVGLALTLVMASAPTLRAGEMEREHAEPGEPRLGEAATVQLVVDSLSEKLGITAVVTVTIVEHDDRRVSVRREPGNSAFALSVERGFVGGLTAEQLEAALAHELGHVWIYTHHPYVQTEQLANRIAMRVVTRRQLVAVYNAMWGADAVHGSLEAFLGLETTTAAQ
ncbi:hypothetical protein [Luteitalea pratensis]|uniref:hypothetical protein n=1 Tax=Luteitalea pratensis TaxID=1855912 RepID=UPI0012FF7E75|nr:hypothetical protein [Luteitalea pratensis]